MNALIKQIRRDLTDLYNEDIIHEAVKLNKQLQTEDFAENFVPMYFTGKHDAKTVFIMLNPGGSKNVDYSFAKSQKMHYESLNHFIESHIEQHINYGELINKTIDNFDLKQAAFLYDFQNSGILIPDFFEDSKQKETKLMAQKNVIANKLQLELIPYCSAKFIGLIDNEKKAKHNLEFFIPHLNRIFDAVIEHKREYVVFGAKQFYYLLKAYNDKTNAVKFFRYSSSKIEKIAKKVSFRCVEIKHNEIVIKGILAYSFPRRDLPNAYKAMREYGGLCCLEFRKVFGE